MVLIQKGAENIL